MPLEGLLELVVTLRERIDGHGAALRQSEALTRYALIDPLLRELGWDTADPDVIVPEYPSSGGRADYSLMRDGNPAMMVEAKSLDTGLKGVLSQGIQYCLEKGTMFFCVTDGRRWEIYETHKPVPIEEKLIASFDLKDDPAQVCLNALALWRPGVESGQVSVGQTPVVGFPQGQFTPVEPQAVQPAPIEDPAVEPTPVVTTPAGEGWLSLSELNPQTGDKAPSEILFPDRSTVQIRNWKSIMVEVTRWLVNRNLIEQRHLPIQMPRARTRSIVSAVPTHPPGHQFTEPRKIGHLHIETNVNGSGAVKNSRRIVEVAGQNPADFRIRVS